MNDEAVDPPPPPEPPVRGARLASFWLYVDRPEPEIVDELVRVHHLSPDEAQAALDQARRWVHSPERR